MAFIRAGGKNSSSRRAAEADLNLGIKIDNTKLRFFILNNLSKQLNKYMQTRLKTIEKRVRSLIVHKLEDSAGWQSVIRGELNQLLELKNAGLVMDQLKSAILEGLTVKFNTVSIEGSHITGGITVGLNISKSKLEAVLGDTQHLTFRTNWLRWILNGEDVNVFNLHIDYEKEIDTLDEATKDLEDDYGADDIANKFLKENADPSLGLGIIGLPIEFRGSFNDNFITKALGGLDADIEQIFKEEINP